MSENPISIVNESNIRDSSWEKEQKYKSIESIYLHGLIDDEQRGNLVGHFIIERDIVGDFFEEKERYAKISSVSVFSHSVWRHKGLGSSMIRKFEQISKDFGASKIVGEIGSADYEEQPWLLKFYEKLGFELTKKGKGFTFEKII